MCEICIKVVQTDITDIIQILARYGPDLEGLLCNVKVLQFSVEHHSFNLIKFLQTGCAVTWRNVKMSKTFGMWTEC